MIGLLVHKAEYSLIIHKSNRNSPEGPIPEAEKSRNVMSRNGVIRSLSRTPHSHGYFPISDL